MAHATTYRIHLHGDGFSGRGVQYRTLSPDEVDQVECLVAESEAAKLGLSYARYNKLVSNEALPLMIVAMTEPVSPDPLPASGETAPKGSAHAQKSTLATATWRPVTPEQIDTDHGGLKQFFTVKDIEVLRKIYTDAHVPGKLEVDKIIAGKVPVSG